MSRKDDLEDRHEGIIFRAFAEADDRAAPQRFDPVGLQRIGAAIGKIKRLLAEWRKEHRRMIEEEIREECRRLFSEWYKKKHPNETPPNFPPTTEPAPSNGAVQPVRR